MQRIPFFLIVTLFATAGAEAQHDVSRRTYTYLGNALTIRVLSDNAGQLQIMRGEQGRLEVAARADRGFPAFALGGRTENELRLTAMGAEHADYLVIVPERTHVRISMPDRRELEVVSSQPAASYTWGSTAVAAANAVSRIPPQPGADGLYLSHFSRSVPREFSIPDLSNITRLDVRFGGTDFRVSTSRLVSVQSGRSDIMQFRAGHPPVHLLLTLPYDTRDFRLVLGGKLALEARTGEIRAFCDQLTEVAAAGSRTFTFNPAERLNCH